MAVRVTKTSTILLTTTSPQAFVTQTALNLLTEKLGPLRVTKTAMNWQIEERSTPIRVTQSTVSILRSIRDAIRVESFLEGTEEFYPNFIVADYQSVIEPDRPQREPNPYKPITPHEVESVDSTLYSYLSEMQETLRQQHNLTQMGDTTYSWEQMTESTPEKLHNLGSIGRFYHDDFGVVICRYVQFQRMKPRVNGHGPVGRLKSSPTIDWVVTNDLTRSSSYLAAGLMPQYDSPVDGSYGWVIVFGANITTVPCVGTLSQDTGVSWTDFEQVGVGAGKIVGRVHPTQTRGFLAPGELFVNIESWSKADIQALIDGSVDPLISRLDDLESQIEQIEGQIGFVDFGPIQSQIDSLRADLNQEAQRRSKADAQIIARLGDPSIYVTQTQFATFQASIIERINSLESSLSVRITNAQTRADAAYALAQANSTSGFQTQIDNINIQIAQMLAALDDFAVDYSNPPQDGDYLVFSSATGRFVPLPPFAGAPVPGSPHGPHRYWRVMTLGQSTNATIAELQFLPKSGDAPLAGTPVFSDESGGAAANAFDGNPSTIWQANAQLAWIGLDLGSGNDSEVGQVVVQAPSAGAVTGLPQEIQVEYSDDGSTWELGWSFLGESAWTNDEFRRYDDPNWNRGSLPSSIGWLGDVDLSSPSDGDILIFDGVEGKWINLAPAGGSGVDVSDEGSPVAPATNLNFTGAGVTATNAGAGIVDIDIPGGGGGSGVDVEDEGTTVATASVINFVGAGVTATDSGSGVVEVDIPGGGGGGGGLKVAPATSFFPTSINSGVVSSVNGIGLKSDMTGGSNTVRGVVKPLAAGAFTAYAQLRCFNRGRDYNAVTLLVWDSSANTGYSVGLYSSGGILLTRWNSLTSRSQITNIGFSHLADGYPFWVAVDRDAAGTCTFYYGPTQDFCTYLIGTSYSSLGGLDQIGFGVDLQNALSSRGYMCSFDDGTDSFYLDPFAVIEY